MNSGNLGHLYRPGCKKGGNLCGLFKKKYTYIVFISSEETNFGSQLIFHVFVMTNTLYLFPLVLAISANVSKCIN